MEVAQTSAPISHLDRIHVSESLPSKFVVLVPGAPRVPSVAQPTTAVALSPTNVSQVTIGAIPVNALAPATAVPRSLAPYSEE